MCRILKTLQPNVLYIIISVIVLLQVLNAVL
jgi:hypothetical protein